jgi:hypothetical protein
VERQRRQAKRAAEERQAKAELERLAEIQAQAAERARRAEERTQKREAERQARALLRIEKREARRMEREAHAARLKEEARARREAAREKRAEARRLKAEAKELAKRARVPTRHQQAAQAAHDAIALMLASACEAATRITQYPCEPSAVINRDWTIDGELRIPAPAIDVTEVLYALETATVWDAGVGYWFSVGFVYTVDPRHQVKSGEAPSIVAAATDGDEEEAATDWRTKYHKRAGTYQELAYPQRENRRGENFATARTILQNLLPYGFRIREILIRVRWSLDGERPPGKHEKQ